MKINPVSKVSELGLNYNQSNSKTQHKNKKYKCPRCNQIIDIKDLIEIFNIDDKSEQEIIAQKMIDKGYEFGSR